jgi:hypothetical protein
MVQFPLVGPAERKGLRRRLEIYLRYRHLLTLTRVIKAASDPIDMWETNTFIASFHARLNVAPQHDSGDAGTGECWKCPINGQFGANRVNLAVACFNLACFNLS